MDLISFLQEKDRKKVERIMPNISRDREMEERFLKDLEEKMRSEDEERLKEIHVSDIVYCLKKAYYRRKGLKGVETKESLMIKSIGKGHHHAYEVLKGYLKETEVKRYGVVGHVDMMGDVPVELKTTRKKISSFLDIPENYLRQIAYYCIMTDTTQAYLIYIYITRPDVKVFKLDYTHVLERYRSEFFGRLNRLKEAIENDDPKILIGTNYEWECQNCPFRSICRGDMR